MHIYGRDDAWLTGLSPRQNRENTEDGNSAMPYIIVAAIGGIVAVAALFVVISRCRQRRGAAGKQPQGRWDALLGPLFGSRSRQYQAAAGGEGAELNTAPGMRQDVERASGSRTSQGGTAGITIDRNTSVRSVLTLPPYRFSASNTERVIGREGDRDGMDVVVDHPTEEEIEALRENEMEALYQLRAARREQQQERTELRRQRQEARERSDFATLAQVQTRSRDATTVNNSAVEELRADISRARESRQRSVSSVSYADLGVARNDGTRIRANSQESERMGLLSDAADLGQQSRSRANSATSQPRALSPGSVVSIDSDMPSPSLNSTRGGAGDDRPDTRRTSTGTALAGSSPELVESDLGVEVMPPPEYEDVPLGDERETAQRDGNTIRSTTPLDEPPPDYPGPYRSESFRGRRGQRDQGEGDEAGEQTTPADARDDVRSGRGIGGVPQLPSLRISQLPEIVIEPSSARPRDDDQQPEGR